MSGDLQRLVPYRIRPGERYSSDLPGRRCAPHPPIRDAGPSPAEQRPREPASPSFALVVFARATRQENGRLVPGVGDRAVDRLVREARILGGRIEVV